MENLYTMEELLKRIEILEGQVRKLELAHLPKRANTKVTTEMLKACYDAGIAATFDQQADFNEYAEMVATKAGMNYGTAKMLIMTAYALKQGELFKCIISGKTAAFFLEQLKKDFGEADLQKGISALQKHIQYRKSLQRDTSLLERIADSYIR